MVHIRELSGDMLLDLLLLVPSRDLIRNCRLVCSQWRDLVDLGTLWKRKCQQEGYLAQGQDRSVPDWKTFYFLCVLKRNLIKNHLAEVGFRYWYIDSERGNEWQIEDLPGSQGSEFPHPHVHKCFVTSEKLCMKLQFINLKNEGYSDKLMDETRPDILVKDWYSVHYSRGSPYKLNVKLLSANYTVLEEFAVEDGEMEELGYTKWREVSHTFHNYPPGTRYIIFKHGGQNTHFWPDWYSWFWTGWYGIRVTNSSITIGPEVASEEESASCQGAGV